MASVPSRIGERNRKKENLYRIHEFIKMQLESKNSGKNVAMSVCVCVEQLLAVQINKGRPYSTYLSSWPNGMITTVSE